MGQRLPSTAAFSIPALWVYFTDVDQLHYKMRVLYLLCTLKSGCCSASKQSGSLSDSPAHGCSFGKFTPKYTCDVAFQQQIPAVAIILGLNIFAPVNLKHYQNCLTVVVV